MPSVRFATPPAICEVRAHLPAGVARDSHASPDNDADTRQRASLAACASSQSDRGYVAQRALWMAMAIPSSGKLPALSPASLTARGIP